MSQWKSSAGPRQTKAVNVAIRALHAHGGKRIEIQGVEGERESRHVIWQYGAELLPAVRDALQQLGERYGWTVTSENYRDIIAAAEDYEKSIPLPEIDCRTPAAEMAKRRAEEAERQKEREAERDARRELLNRLEPLRPKSTKTAVVAIVASLDECQSDSQTDYFAHRSTRHVVIGWRTGSREDFRQLRAAAARFPETAHLGTGCDEWYVSIPLPPGEHYDSRARKYVSDNGDLYGSPAVFRTEAAAREFAARYGLTETAEYKCESVEHRENYSMGGGNYLKAGGRHDSGWSVRTYDVVHLPSGPIDIAPHLLVPVAPQVAAPETPADDPASTADGAPSWCENTEKGGVEIRFPAKPPARILERLKEHGFRWSRFAGCWWHKKTELTVAVAVAICAELSPAPETVAVN